LNLLFVLPEFYPATSGGICTYYRELFKANRKWNITVIQGSAVETRGGEACWEGIKIHYLTLELLNKYKGYFKDSALMPEFQNHIASAWAIYDLAQQLNNNFDAVVTTDWGFGFIPWIIKNEKPVIVHLHGSVGQIDYYEPRPGWQLWSNLYLQIESTLFSHADALVTHSKQNVNFWDQRLLLKKDIKLIPPAVTKADKNSIAERKEDNGKSVGLVVGRIQYWKGVIQLCEAINLLSEEKRRKLKIYWVGRDTFYAAAKSSMDKFLCNQYPKIWKNIIEPVGEKKQEEIREFYALSNWSLVPSTWDMFNLAAVEHVMNKKPLICSTGAGASDFLDSDDIYLFNNTPKGLAGSIERVLDLNANKLKEIGEKGYLFASKKFDPESVHMQHDYVIETAIKNFTKKSNLEYKFSWLLPNREGNDYRNPKEVLLANWSLKEVITLFIKRVRAKFKI
jgi:glycosyltransferase involved in cell wall biosynthesis